VITEKQFALGFSGFWQGLLPMMENHIRSTNERLERFARPMVSSSPTATHGLVSELAFRMFVASAQARLPVEALSSGQIRACVEAATSHIRGMRQLSRTPVPDPRPDEIAEATLLAQRHTLFFKRADELILMPTFPGCGWLMECSGDVLSGSMLYEVKAGQRGFRSLDIRQALIYCALNFAAKHHDIASVCLVNPRLGVFVEEDLEDLCLSLSGAPAVEVLAAIVEYCSESQDRYNIG
jgi:hypothetical protein